MTREDLKLILRMSIHMARVDQELNLEERRILMRFADAMRLSALERERLMGKTLTLGEALKKLSSDAGKKAARQDRLRGGLLRWRFARERNRLSGKRC